MDRQNPRLAERKEALRRSLAHLPVERAAAKAPPGSRQGLPGYSDRCANVGVQGRR